MKLSALNAAIRDCETAPWVNVAAPTPSGFLRLALQKTPLLAALKDEFPEGRNAETGMKLTEEGHLVRDD